MSKRPRRKLDRLDAESMHETVQTRGWKLYKARILGARDKRIRSLLNAQTEIETATTRGFIEALDIALKIPDILIHEADRRQQAADVTIDREDD